MRVIVKSGKTLSFTVLNFSTWYIYFDWVLKGPFLVSYNRVSQFEIDVRGTALIGFWKSHFWCHIVLLYSIYYIVPECVRQHYNRKPGEIQVLRKRPVYGVHNPPSTINLSSRMDDWTDWNHKHLPGMTERSYKCWRLLRVWHIIDWSKRYIYIVVRSYKSHFWGHIDHALHYYRKPGNAASSQKTSLCILCMYTAFLCSLYD